MNANKLTPDKLKEAILIIDDKILYLDMILRILKSLPPQETLDNVTSYEVSDLDVAETFCFAIGSVPKCVSRLKAMAFRFRLSAEVSCILPDSVVITKAIRQIKSSERFKEVLRMVLVTGNFLNGETFRGNARGFKVTTLLSLLSLQSQDLASPTLLHYIARRLELISPNAISFIDDLPDVEEARRIQPKSLVDGCKSLKESFKAVQRLVKEPLVHLQTRDRFRMVFDQFSEGAGKEIQKLDKVVGQMWEDSAALLEWIGEDGELDTVLDAIFVFSQSLMTAHLENQCHDLQNPGEEEREVVSMFTDSLKKRIVQLKPVDGQEPFWKRGTVYRSLK